MEPVEDQQGQADAGDDSPREEAVEPQLESLRYPVVSRHEGVHDPEGDVREPLTERDARELATEAASCGS